MRQIILLVVASSRNNRLSLQHNTIQYGKSPNQGSDDGVQEQPFSEEARANLMEKMREFDAKLKLDREKLNLDRERAKTDAELKRKALNKKPQTSK